MLLGSLCHSSCDQLCLCPIAGRCICHLPGSCHISCGHVSSSRLLNSCCLLNGSVALKDEVLLLVSLSLNLLQQLRGIRVSSLKRKE